MGRRFCIQLIVLPFSLLLSLSVSMAKPESITYFQSDYRYQYDIELLQLALDLTASEYGYVNTRGLNFKTYIEGLRALGTGDVDVAFLATSRRYEANYLPVRVPILQGMLGYRLLLIHNNNQELFSQIQTLDNLKNRAVAGLGLYWEDLRILYANRLPVVANADYPGLFNLLISGQVDYLPRGLNEVYTEIEKIRGEHPQIMLNEEIAIYYPFVRYYFVHPDNHQLAQRIEKGLAKAKANGQFRALFDKHYLGVIRRANLKEHRVIYLENPFLPESLPKIESDWWLPK